MNILCSCTNFVTVIITVVFTHRAQVVSQSTPRGKLSQLTLTPTTRDDSGFYTCNAKNKFGNAVLVNNLVIHGKTFCCNALKR